MVRPMYVKESVPRVFLPDLEIFALDSPESRNSTIPVWIYLKRSVVNVKQNCWVQNRCFHA